MSFKHTLIIAEELTDEDLLIQLFRFIIWQENTSPYNLFSVISSEINSNFAMEDGKVLIQKFSLKDLNSAFSEELSQVDQALFKAVCISRRFSFSRTEIVIFCSRYQDSQVLVQAAYLAKSFNININVVALSSEAERLSDIAVLTNGGYFYHSNSNAKLLYLVLEKHRRQFDSEGRTKMLRCKKCGEQDIVENICNCCGSILCDECCKMGKCAICEVAFLK